MDDDTRSNLACRALEELASIRKRHRHDLEASHVEADGVLCRLLEALGFSEVVDAYDEIDKLYI